MKLYLLTFLFIFSSLLTYSQQRKYTLAGEAEYDPSTVIVKLKSTSAETARGGEVSLKSLPVFNKIKINNVEPALTHIENLNAAARTGGKPHPLANIYRLTLEPGEEVVDVINKLLLHDEVVYAEPYFDHKPLLTPNDPEAAPNVGRQTYLEIIKAYDAWTIEQGDTTVVIAILDTGIELNHEDLKGNISYNYDDPINGVDDDGDGLVDNFRGWDIANNDNNPEADTDAHGIYVSGLSSASTNNGTGIAGTGFKSKVMPIKIFLSGFNSFSRGYEAIALAADLGCQVINLSWGSINSFSQYGQDIINYAVLEKDAAIVAAAGNTDGLLDFYPASYDNVISVGATDIDDTKPAWSTYSYNIDLVAPGHAVYTTKNGGSYAFSQGSSLSSPLVAGTVALIRARFPDLSALQVMERVRVTADNIYNISANLPYYGKLGKGRLNMLNALTDNSSPSIRIQKVNYDNGSGSYAFYGDTLSINMEFKNYLSKASPSTTASLSCSSPYVTVLESEFKIGTLATLGTTSNGNAPFKVLLHDDLPPKEELYFRIDFKDGAYQDYQYIKIKSSPNYVTLNNDTLGITAGSNGNLGYNKDGKLEGIGITYQGTNILDHIGMINATSSTEVVDNAPIYLSVHERSKDFSAVKNIKFYNNSEADIDLRNTFYDNTGVLNINVEQKTLAWTDASSSNFKILEYRITNLGSSTLTDLHTAIFADWNLNAKDFNKADWDATHNLGYIKDTESDTLYAGLALLSNQDPIYFAINNKNFNGNIADISPLLSDSKKYSLVSQGVGKASAGNVNNGNDVSHVLGGTISTLEVNQSEKVAIAVVAGRSLVELQNSIAQAQTKYQEYLNSPPLLYTAYTCPSTSTTIDPPQGDVYEFYEDVSLTNLLETGSSFTTPIVNSPQTYYVVNKDNVYDGDVLRVIAAPKHVNADFSITNSPLLLDETGNTTVSMTDLSKDAVAWHWDFDNGYTSSVQNPIMNYPETGTFNIKLTATNDIGCVEMTSKTLTVANRSNRPNIDDQSICKGETVNLSATNATQLKVYDDALLSNEIHSGTAFTSGEIYNDTVFYITSVDSLYESNPKKVSIEVSDVKADFTYTIDTLDLSQKSLLHFTSQSEHQVLYYWFVDDMLAKVNNVLDVDYSGLSSFEVKLVAEDVNSCYDIMSKVITTAASPAPVAESMEICKGESVNLQPSNGQIFFFYSDPDLQNLEHKGSSVYLNEVVADTAIYITNVDSLQESAATEVKIAVSDLKAAFTTVVLAEVGTNPIIQNESTGATSYAWVIDGDTVSTDANPNIIVNKNDTYNVQLFVTDDLGCQDSVSHPIYLEVISGIGGEIENTVMLYPNPARERIHITNRGDSEITLLTTNGQVILELPQSKDYIDISNLPDGVYMVRVTSNSSTFYRKVAKKSE